MSANPDSAPADEELLDWVRAALIRRKGQWPEIAALSDVPRDTISKIVRGVTENPGVLGCQRLRKVLRMLDEQDQRIEAERHQLPLLSSRVPDG